MTKDQRNTVVEYAGKLSDEELRFIASRLTDRYHNDVPTALDRLSTSEVADSVLSTANSSGEFFALCDQFRDVLAKEAKRRNLSIKQGQGA